MKTTHLLFFEQKVIYRETLVLEIGRGIKRQGRKYYIIGCIVKLITDDTNPLMMKFTSSRINIFRKHRKRDI
jgi:hypothetical protein